MKLLTVSFIIIFCLTTADNSIKFIKNDYKEALNQAKSSYKLIFVDVYTDWCAPCKVMDKYVFTDEKISSFYNESFVNLKINAEKGEGIKIANKYDIEAYPTLLFLNSKGQVVYRSVGGKGTQDFLALGQRAANPDFYPNNMAQKLKDGQDDETFLLTGLDVFRDNRLIPELNEVIARYFEKGYYQNEQELLNLAEKYLYNVDTKLFVYLNKLGLEQPDKAHYLSVTINRIATNYLNYDNSLSVEKFGQILSESILDEETQAKLLSKARGYKQVDFKMN